MAADRVTAILLVISGQMLYNMCDRKNGIGTEKVKQNGND